ncbi:MAG: hypothetical protein IKN54_09580, partial [Lachnospiraceae bacterium]|nr:hypothetical protein [Lachnospiraceae bacterium]
LEAGGDGIAVNKKSIQIELYHLGTTPKEIDSSTPHLTLVQKGVYEDGKLKEALNQNDANLNFGNGDIGLKVNHYYEIKVTGADVDGNDLDSKARRYGFKRYSTFAPPSVTFESATGTLSENQYISTAKLNASAGIKIKGKVVTATKNISIESKDKIILNGITIGGKIVPDSDYEYKVETFTTDSEGDDNSGKIYTFIAKITAKSGTSLDVTDNPGSHKCKVSFSAVDSLSGGQNESYDFEFKLDNAKPVISGVTVSPTVNKTENNVTTAYVNGTITVSGNVSDVGSGFKTLKYGINTANSSAAQEVDVEGATWSFDYVTTLKQDGTYNLKIYAIDTVGNEQEYTEPLNIKQSTDTPVIDFTNAGIMFTKASNILIGNVTDDDGLQSVTAKYKKTSPVPGTEKSFDLAALSTGTTSYSINAKLPADEEGEYLITVVAKDNKNLPTGTNKYPAFTVKKDEGAPVITITSPNTNSQNYNKGDITVSGKAKDGSGEVTLTRTVKKDNQVITSLNKTDISVSDPATSDPDDKKAIANGTVVWRDTINFKDANKGSGVYEVTYEAVDKYNHKSTLSASFLIDVNSPTVKTVKLDNKTITQNDWSKTSDAHLTVTAEDVQNESDLAAVQYNINNY